MSDDSGPAFPLTEDAIKFRNKDFPMQGLTKRELFTLAMTMAFVLRPIPGEGVGFAPFNPLEADQRHHFIEVGLMMADDMLAALNKTNSRESENPE